MIISNRVRFTVWALLIFIGLLISKLILDEIIGLTCITILCVLTGFSLFIVISWVSSVTGKWLATYGKGKEDKFGEIKRLVRLGPYSCMRHPMHLFLSLAPIAFGLIIASPSMTLIVGPLEMIIILILAVTIDEKESIYRFRNEYLKYRKEVPAFNLSFKCIVKAFKPPKH